jgi:hypothetical protein
MNGVHVGIFEGLGPVLQALGAAAASGWQVTLCMAFLMVVFVGCVGWLARALRRPR